MPRPGQQNLRRKRARAEMEAGSSTSTPNSHYAESYTFDQSYQSTSADVEEGQGEQEDNDEQINDNPRSQCLPVGILPLDFDDNPLDGSQYLAMANRDNQNLPFVKSVENPFEQKILSPLQSSLPLGNGGSSSTSRHPALPQESWQVLFPIHFQGYRKHIQSQISSSSKLPYPSNYPPIPNISRRSDWYGFINGYLSPDKSTTKTKKGKEKAKPVLTEEEMMNASMVEGMDLDEEESKDAEVVEKVVIGKTSNGNEKRIGATREPLLSVLRKLNSSSALKILSHFSHWISESIDQSPPPIPFSPELLPTQPDYSPSSPYKEKEVKIINPLSSNYFNWIFSLLLILDNQLSSDEISILRELARASMRVAGHKWILGVVGKDIDEHWLLGNNWKAERDSGEKQIGPQIPKQNESEAVQGVQEIVNGEKVQNDNSVDEILARCWMIVHAVSAGWGQKDLLSELETLFT